MMVESISMPDTRVRNGSEGNPDGLADSLSGLSIKGEGKGGLGGCWTNMLPILAIFVNVSEHTLHYTAMIDDCILYHLDDSGISDGKTFCDVSSRLRDFSESSSKEPGKAKETPVNYSWRWDVLL